MSGDLWTVSVGLAGSHLIAFLGGITFRTWQCRRDRKADDAAQARLLNIATSERDRMIEQNGELIKSIKEFFAEIDGMTAAESARDEATSRLAVNTSALLSGWND